jgi:uncharacterized membrane protein YdbT with pleckstrin-like domain
MDVGDLELSDDEITSSQIEGEKSDPSKGIEHDESSCEIIEQEPLEVEHGKNAKEHSKWFLSESKNTLKTLILNAFSWLAAQAIQSFVQAMINQIYPPATTQGWMYVVSQLVYAVVVVLCALLISFVWHLGETKAIKRWKMTCSEKRIPATEYYQKKKKQRLLKGLRKQAQKSMGMEESSTGWIDPSS